MDRIAEGAVAPGSVLDRAKRRAGPGLVRLHVGVSCVVGGLAPTIEPTTTERSRHFCGKHASAFPAIRRDRTTPGGSRTSPCQRSSSDRP